MRILALSDIHGHFGDFPPDALPDADVVLIAGDVTDFGINDPEEAVAAAQWMGRMADRYRNVGYVPGNHDLDVDNKTWASDSAESGDADGRSGTARLRGCVGLDLTPHRFALPDAGGDAIGHSASDGAVIVGVSQTPCFDMPVLEEIWDYMTADPAIDSQTWDTLPTADVVVAHGPPEGVLDRTRHGRHPGSPGALRYIERRQPRLYLCGHIHEAAGFAGVNGTRTAVFNIARTAVLIVLHSDIAESDGNEIEWQVVEHRQSSWSAAQYPLRGRRNFVGDSAI